MGSQGRSDKGGSSWREGSRGVGRALREGSQKDKENEVAAYVTAPKRARGARRARRGRRARRARASEPSRPLRALLWRLRAKSKTRNATLTSQSRVLSQQPRSRVLEQRSSSLNPTLYTTQSSVCLTRLRSATFRADSCSEKHRPNTFERSQVSATPLNIAGAVNFRGEAAFASLSRALLSSG